MRTFLFFLAALLVAASSTAQTTTRRSLKPLKKPATEKARSVRSNDTLKADTAWFRIFGYEKTLRSTSESFFVTNLSTDTVSGVGGTIDYRTLGDSQLHKRDFSSSTLIPPGQTRQITLPAWDKQKVWYYHLSPAPRGGTRATPYKVGISITACFRPKR